MPKPFWKFQNVAGGRAELLLYGDISDSTWWGDEVTPKQFAEDLDKLGAVSEITVRINSGFGTNLEFEGCWCVRPGLVLDREP